MLTSVHAVSFHLAAVLFAGSQVKWFALSVCLVFAVNLALFPAITAKIRPVYAGTGEDVSIWASEFGGTLGDWAVLRSPEQDSRKTQTGPTQQFSHNNECVCAMSFFFQVDRRRSLPTTSHFASWNEFEPIHLTV